MRVGTSSLLIPCSAPGLHSEVGVATLHRLDMLVKRYIGVDSPKEPEETTYCSQ